MLMYGQFHMLSNKRPLFLTSTGTNNPTILAYIAFQMYMPRTIQIQNRNKNIRLCLPPPQLSDRDPLLRNYNCREDDYIWYGMTRLIGNFNYDDALAYASNFYSMRPWLDPYTNETALHLTCKACACAIQRQKKQNQHEHMIQFLIKSFPDAVLMQELYHGRTPLHLAAVSSDVPFEMYRILLLADPRASIIQDDYGCAPFDILWAAFIDVSETIRTGASDFLSRLRACEKMRIDDVGDLGVKDAELGDFFHKAALLLHAAQRTLEEAATQAHDGINDDRGGRSRTKRRRFARDDSGISRPISPLLRYHAKLTGTECKHRQRSSTESKVELMFCYQNEDELSSTADSLLVLYAVITSSCKISCPALLREVITRMFLLAIQKMQVEDASSKAKRSFLSRCCELGISWGGGLEDIVMATPCALSRRDTFTDLFPFMQAACVGNYTSRDQLDSIYCLLRHDPSAMRKALVC